MDKLFHVLVIFLAVTQAPVQEVPPPRPPLPQETVQPPPRPPLPSDEMKEVQSVLEQPPEDNRMAV